MFGGGIFGSMFDFDGDGVLNAAERAVEFMALEQMMAEEKERDFLSDSDADWVESDFF